MRKKVIQQKAIGLILVIMQELNISLQDIAGKDYKVSIQKKEVKK